MFRIPWPAIRKKIKVLYFNVVWGCPSLVKVVGTPTTRGRAGEVGEQRDGAVWGCLGV